MSSSGGGYCDPYGHVLFVDYSPYESFGRLPAFFSHLYPNDVPMHAELLDPVGNPYVLRVEMIGDNWYFTNGWSYLGKVYGIENGAYLRLVYVRRGCFEFTIKTYKMVEWIYPPVPEPLEGGFGSSGVNQAIDDQDVLIANNNAFPFRAVKWVSFSELTGDVMSLPPQFLRDAVVDAEAEIYIVDEFGKRWPCYLRRGYGGEAFTSFVCRGWARFCRRKGFQQGQRIVFGVTHAKSNQMHYIPGG